MPGGRGAWRVVRGDGQVIAVRAGAIQALRALEHAPADCEARGPSGQVVRQCDAKHKAMYLRANARVREAIALVRQMWLRLVDDADGLAAVRFCLQYRRWCYEQLHPSPRSTT